ncbi:MAG: nickel pincer cofactor biosynthesis protein LarB [Planctomycetota bacterium]|nr:nickel pincer cofactor biosynthesis protein LarB [Planctomycetota bacterium]
MNNERLRELLKSVHEGHVTPDEAAERLRHMPFEDLGFAKLDHHRSIRCGFPEVIFCQGKTTEQVVAIITRMTDHGHAVLATRAAPEVYEAVRARHPEAIYHSAARAIVLVGRQRCPRLEGLVAVVSAGTSDQPVAEEARVTAEVMGCRTEPFYDVGVAGIHRLLAHTEAIAKATVVIVVAGMEGALASVVGGLVDVPVIGVPTSIGYGASFQGLAPLLTMLNSCAAGVGVVNIDNGFGAGYLAALVVRAAAQGKETRGE